MSNPSIPSPTAATLSLGILPGLLLVFPIEPTTIRLRSTSLRPPRVIFAPPKSPCSQPLPPSFSPPPTGARNHDPNPHREQPHARGPELLPLDPFPSTSCPTSAAPVRFQEPLCLCPSSPSPSPLPRRLADTGDRHLAEDECPDSPAPFFLSPCFVSISCNSPSLPLFLSQGAQDASLPPSSPSLPPASVWHGATRFGSPTPGYAHSKCSPLLPLNVAAGSPASSPCHG